MSMNVGNAEGDDDEVVSAINTTPLVDVMLVLLIIFLITIPVVTHTIPVKLPPETNQPLQTKPQNIIIAVTKDGDYYWDQQKARGYRGAEGASWQGHRQSGAAARGPYPWRHDRPL